MDDARGVVPQRERGPEYVVILVSEAFDGVPWLERVHQAAGLWDADAMGAAAEVHCYTTAEFERKREALPVVRWAAERGAADTGPVDRPSRFARTVVSGHGAPVTPHVSTTLLRTQTDERLVELIAAGHDRAFDAIVDRYRRPLLRYARRFLPEEARAEDVVQAAFVSAWGALRDGATGP